MVTAQCPTRISLFGGGTDLPSFSTQYGGITISLAINLYQKINFDTSKNKLAPKDNPMFFERLMEELKSKENIEHSYDCVIESGLGSSASLTVALVGAWAKHNGIYLNKREIAERAYELEVERLGLYGGKQDQYTACIGGMNIFYFTQTAGVQITNIERDKAEFVAKHLLLFYTGDNRKDTKIQEQLKVLTPDKTRALMNIKTLAHDAKKYLQYGDFKMLGELFDRAWSEKKKSNPLITTDKIDKIYDVAISYGAEGGKLCGSGGGGFMVFWVSPGRQGDIIRALTDMGCIHYDYSLDYNGLNTRVLPK